MTSSHNRRAWDDRAAKGQRFTQPARDEDFVDPLAKVDQLGWLGGDIRGKTLLCLAAGGGKHGPLYAAAGATVTVVDLSPGMLELDRAGRGRAAARRCGRSKPRWKTCRCSPPASSTSSSTPSAPATCRKSSRSIARSPASRAPAASTSASTSRRRACRPTSQPSPRGYELIEPYYRGPAAAGRRQPAPRGRHARISAPLGGPARPDVPRRLRRSKTSSSRCTPASTPTRRLRPPQPLGRALHPPQSPPHRQSANRLVGQSNLDALSLHA